MFHKPVRLFAFSTSILVILGVMLVGACSPQVPTATQEPAPDVAGQPRQSSQVEADTFPYPRPADSIRFSHLGQEDGLSQSTVRCILQDHRGFMWFGTEDGLNRYDGYTIKVYRPNPDNPHSINDGWINTLYQDRQGYIWVGTRLGGLNRYNPVTDRFTHYLHDPTDSDSLTSNQVQAIFEDSRGRLWVGTNEGLDLFDGATGNFIHYEIMSPDPAYPSTTVTRVIDQELGSNNVTAIYEDRDGKLWIGTTNGGFNRFVEFSETFVPFVYNPYVSSGSPGYIYTALQDREGVFWIASNTGLLSLDSSTFDVVRYAHVYGNPDSLASNFVNALFLDQAGNLWVGTDNGLDRFVPATGEFIHYRHEPGNDLSLSTNPVLSIYEDRGGVLWIGTYGGGVNIYDREQDSFAYYHHQPDNPNSLSGNIISPIHVDDKGIVWIGTYGSGLNRFDPGNYSFTRYQHNPDDPNSLQNDIVLSVFMDGTDTLWVGTVSGLDYLKPDTNSFIHYMEEPGAVLKIPSTRINVIHGDYYDPILWIGTDSGLYCYYPQSNRVLSHFRYESNNPNSLSDNVILAIHEDLDGILWIGTSNSGLVRYDQWNGVFTRYLHSVGDPNTLSNNTVHSIYRDKQGVLWVGTSGGLNRFSPETESFKYYRVRDGLPNNVIYGIVEDKDGYLWLSTNYGISHFDPDAVTFRNYTASAGLQSSEFSQQAYARDLEGRVYFGGINGLTVFNPSEIMDNPYVPPIALTSLTQDGEPLNQNVTVESLQEVTLKWPDNKFEFEFAALSFAQHQDNQYAYMLENYDTDWYYSGTFRSGRYANLPGGTYTLRMKASNNDGVWNEDGMSVEVTVVPPFWQNNWFRGVMAALLLGLAIGGYRLRVRSVELRSWELERLVQERTSDLEKRTQEVEALYSADEKMLRTQTLKQVYQTLVDVAVEMLQADCSAVYVWNEEQTTLSAQVSRGFTEGTLKVMRFAKDQGLIGEVIATGRPVLITSLEDAPIPEQVKQAMLSDGIGSVLHLPILVENQVVGIFNASFLHPVAFTEDIIRLFTALIQRAALSIENARLFEQTKELAVIEERNRLARDLHDSAKQKAFAALAQLGTVNGVLAANPTAARDHLSEAENLVFEVIQELTFLIQEMYPVGLKERGLVVALREYIFEWENRNDIEVNLKIEGERRLKLEVEQAIYRIIQEAMANIARHSHASQVDLSLVYTDENIEVVVADNGAGFDVLSRPPGMGLRSIRERVESIGGIMSLESCTGKGTCLTVRVPLKGSLE